MTFGAAATSNRHWCRFWNTQPLLRHMVCSNEPGYYEDGAFGIRVENLFVVVEVDTEFRCRAGWCGWCLWCGAVCGWRGVGQGV